MADQQVDALMHYALVRAVLVAGGRVADVRPPVADGREPSLEVPLPSLGSTAYWQRMNDLCGNEWQYTVILPDGTTSGGVAEVPSDASPDEVAKAIALHDYGLETAALQLARDISSEEAEFIVAEVHYREVGQLRDMAVELVEQCANYRRTILRCQRALDDEGIQDDNSFKRPLDEEDELDIERERRGYYERLGLLAPSEGDRSDEG